MAKQSEDLIDEARDNLTEDRTKMRSFIDLLDSASKVEEGVDPLAKIALADAYAKMSGELTKNNALLVELAKIKMKKELFRNPNDGFSDDETDGMFDEIEGAKNTTDDDHN